MILRSLSPRRRYVLVGGFLFVTTIFLLRQGPCKYGWGACLEIPPYDNSNILPQPPEQAPVHEQYLKGSGDPSTTWNPLHHSTVPPQGADSAEHIVYQQLREKIQQFVQAWDRPDKKQGGRHWPPYQNYIDKDYDPNRWEAFEWNNDFYASTGISKIKEEYRDSKPVPYSPYPAYNSAEWKQIWQGQHVACLGPRGRLLSESEEDIVKAYQMPPGAFPAVSVGDANETGIDLSVCFDRYHRYGPYGFGDGEQETASDWERPQIKPDWAKVGWDQLQNRCLMANQQRYDLAARHFPNTRPQRAHNPPDGNPHRLEEPTGSPRSHPRTAILVRTWEGYNYQENDLQAIRALITETALLSGAEYHVFLFVNVKDKEADFFGDPGVHQNILEQNVPEEFWDISILWSEALLQEWYPEVGDWQVYWSQFMPLQWFAKTYPEFDFVWNWETDVRYTGNHYHFLEGVSQFAQRFPRKYMWERNQRFFFPGVHGSYREWLDATDLEIERGMREGTTTPVWGPKPYNATRQNPIGPTPPTSMEHDHFQWGVGEEADLITLLPIFDPINTKWSYRNKIWNFVPGVRPHFTEDDGLDADFDHEEFVHIPRRVYINTVSRFSQRLLHAMHLENLAGRTMQAEMWPATVALHHGLKAVHSPHPIWMDRQWPGWYADAVFNADGGKAAQWSQAEDSAYAHDREHNYAGWSWYYDGTFAKSLYRRWLGWSSRDTSSLRNVDWQAFENDGVTITVPESTHGYPLSQSTNIHIGGQGRMCLPGMLLHPVKKVFKLADKPSDE